MYFKNQIVPKTKINNILPQFTLKKTSNDFSLFTQNSAKTKPPASCNETSKLPVTSNVCSQWNFLLDKFEQLNKLNNVNKLNNLPKIWMGSWHAFPHFLGGILLLVSWLRESNDNICTLQNQNWIKQIVK